MSSTTRRARPSVATPTESTNVVDRIADFITGPLVSGNTSSSPKHNSRFRLWCASDRPLLCYWTLCTNGHAYLRILHCGTIRPKEETWHHLRTNVGCYRAWNSLQHNLQPLLRCDDQARWPIRSQGISLNHIKLFSA